MKKISGATVFYKKILPAYWFGFLAVFASTGLAFRETFFVVAPLGMAIFGFFLFRYLVWDLVDEAYDAGDYLLFRKGGVEQRVPLSDIVNVDTQRSNPERITSPSGRPARWARN